MSAIKPSSSSSKYAASWRTGLGFSDLARSEGGANLLHNLILLCEKCHDWIEVHEPPLRSRAEIEGSYGEATFDASVPIRREGDPPPANPLAVHVASFDPVRERKRVREATRTACGLIGYSYGWQPEPIGEQGRSLEEIAEEVGLSHEYLVQLAYDLETGRPRGVLPL